MKLKSFKSQFIVILILAVILFSGCQKENADAGIWRVGVAKVAITPSMPVWLAGYDRDTKSVEVHDDIWARALALDNGERTIVIVTTDLIGLMLNFVDEIRDELVSDGLERDNIIITATHQHSGPDVIGLWNVDKKKSGVDKKYMSELKTKIIVVIQKALVSKQDAVLAFSETEVRGISYNGRDKGVDDFSVVTLHASTPDSQTIAVLVNFACHPEVLTSGNKYITSDYVHYMYQTLESELGGTALFVNGALGGMLTPLVTENTFKEAERCGKSLAVAVLDAISREKAVESKTLISVRKRINLAVPNQKFQRFSQNGIIHRSFSNAQVETEVGILKIGPAIVATIPGEALPKIGLAIKDAMDTEYKMIFGLANDELGYLIQESDWRPDAYEESMSVGPKGGDTVQKEIIALLK